MVPKEIFETLGFPKGDGHFHLPPSCIRAALFIEPQAQIPLATPPSPSPRKSSVTSFYSNFSFSSVRSPIYSGSILDYELEEINAEIARDQENVARAKASMKKLKLLSGSNSLASIPSTVPEIPSAFLPRGSIIDRIKDVLLPNYTSQNLSRFDALIGAVAQSGGLSSQSGGLRSKTMSVDITLRNGPSSADTINRQASAQQLLSQQQQQLPPPPTDRGNNKSVDGANVSSLQHLGSMKSSSKANQRTCVVQGMGGMGKSTLVASFAHDTEVRSAFDKIVWISIGQTPDIVALQESIHLQLTGQPIPSSVSLLPASIIPEQRRAALKAAASGACVLCILDDLWDVSIEKDFNFIDRDAGSALLVSTRIRGLLKHCAVEVRFRLYFFNDAHVITVHERIAFVYTHMYTYTNSAHVF
jgi:hypothetical protein